jgi:dTDP-4-amino-4,6-dideoxygalactose transaminase
VHEFGLNYRLPDILCALGITQLERLFEFKDQKSRIYSKYIDGFNNLPGVDIPAKNEYVEVNWHLFPLRVNKENRQSIFDRLRLAGIGVQVNYIPAYWHPVFESYGFRRGDFPIADLFYSREISLPMYPTLEDSQIDYVIETVKALIKDS